MKQPELGKVIQQHRLSMGMTQEELVERCNISVRTIQRIESGEVTPRSYTIKIIQSVLGIPLDPPLVDRSLDSIPDDFSAKDRQVFFWSAIIGLAYFILSSYEVFWELTLMADDRQQIPPYYTLLKVLVLVSYAGFAYGFYRIGQRIQNSALMFGAAALIVINAIIIGSDLYYDPSAAESQWMGIYGVVVFGISLIPFSIGLILSLKSMGEPYRIVGIVGLVTGFLFISLLLAFIGLFTWAVFDIACIYLLFRQSQGRRGN
ncbi:helix-turn-helix domain-containing protein [Echinicola pacifica]|nr:helix-turn-helix domain-containing protein [Echinicola pacifica]